MDDTTTVKVCEKCRRIRLTVVFMFMISSVLAGVFWAQDYESTNRTSLLLAIALTAFSTVLILGVEIVVTKVELEAKRLHLQLNDKLEEVRILKERIADLNRSIDLLARDDDNVRRELLDERIHRAPVAARSPESQPGSAT